MPPTILNTKDFNLKNVTFSDVKTNKRGGKTVYLKYKNPMSNKEHPIYLQTPKMYCPFGASAFKSEEKSNDAPRYSLNLSFRGEKENPTIKELSIKLQQVDDYTVKNVLRDKEWLEILGLHKKKDLTPEMVEMVHTSLVRESTKDDSIYPPNLNIKLPVKFGTEQFMTEIFNKKKEKVEITYENIGTVIPGRGEVRGLLHIASIWFVGGKFGITVRASQLVVYPSETLTGYSFLDSDSDSVSEDEDEDEDSEEADEPTTVGAEDSSESEKSSDSDSEEETVEESTEVEEVAPKKTRKPRKPRKST